MIRRLSIALLISVILLSSGVAAETTTLVNGSYSDGDRVSVDPPEDSNVSVILEGSPNGSNNPRIIGLGEHIEPGDLSAGETYETQRFVDYNDGYGASAYIAVDNGTQVDVRIVYSDDDPAESVAAAGGLSSPSNPLSSYISSLSPIAMSLIASVIGIAVWILSGRIAESIGRPHRQVGFVGLVGVVVVIHLVPGVSLIDLGSTLIPGGLL